MLCIFISCFCLVFPLLAQSNRLIKELESKRGALQKQITESETLLKTTKKTVSSQLNGLAALTGQIEERKRYILTINKDVEAIDRELSSLERQLGQLQRDLKDKKRKYDSSVQYLYKNRSIEEKLMFIFSAQSLAQTYRRLRYVREYATYQRLQGEEILKKQEQVNKKKAELRQVRAAKADLLKERESEKMKLEKPATASGASKTKAAPLETYTMSKADRELSGDFANNRGKLPMPISGAYIITSHYGQYAVEGLRNVKLDNKGIDIQGRPGAQARAIFNGKVAAVFKLNGLFNILIRHGAYISVYCNLSSALVKQGDTVTTKQAIGQVFSDGADGGRTVLHFQLRREKEKLNPEPWLNR